MFANEQNKTCLTTLVLQQSRVKKFLGIVVIILFCLLLACPAWADTVWLEKQKLTAEDGFANDFFGCSVSISGDYAIVGARWDDDRGINSGSAYIFKWDGTGWVQQQKLLASDGAAGDEFGQSVSISGDYAIVGAIYDDDRGTDSGSAYIFKRNGETWVQQQKLTASDGAANDNFGCSVSISGDYAIVGASYDNDKGSESGSAYIFKRDGETWLQQAKLLASDGAAWDIFGNSVSISGDYAIVGAYWGDGNVRNSGSAYIFRWDGTGWIQQQKLTASDGAANDWFSNSVSISGDYAIVGAFYDDDRGTDSGSAYIFRWDGAGWVQQQKLTASDGAAYDRFGVSVSISGDYAIIGAYYGDGNEVNSGSAYIFRWNGTAWIQQQKLTASDGAVGDFFGISVSISGDYAIVGAYYDDDKGNKSGSSYIFIPTGTGTLTVLAPNGGEKLVAGSTYNITWDTNGIVENVFIEYSANNGGNWTAIDTVANTGSYPWLVPDVNSYQCLVRISDVSNPDVNDISDDVFRIYVCADWLTADLNSDCFVDFTDFSIFADQWLKCGDPCDPNCQP